MVMIIYYNILSGCPLVSNGDLSYQEALIGSNFVKISQKIIISL